ncbi:Thioesterase/thiol ester dehydrase-isomerase, partial [Sodiomyces alkalinus F11]
DIFTNARPQWLPPGARGIFGGAVIAQSLAAAQRTVPTDSSSSEGVFLVHSCHCYFLLAGDAAIPLLFHVERVRDGRSFATRTVQARQKGRCVFTATISFVREGAGGRKLVTHAPALPPGVVPPGAGQGQDAADAGEPVWGESGPFETTGTEVVWPEEEDGTAGKKEDQVRCRSWVRARGKVSEAGGLAAHLNALAYVSDAGFIGTVARVHRLMPRLKATRDGDGEGKEGHPVLGMMVSLDHSIYFHAPRRVKVDEWMFSEMETPWAGDGRGLVTRRIFAADGTLLATCVQEGVVRLQQDKQSGNAKL